MARRARWFLVGWLVVVLLGFGAAGGMLGTEGLFARLKPDDAPQVPGDARTGADLLEAASSTGTTVQFLLDGVRPGSAAVRGEVTRAAADLGRVPHVAQVLQPYPPVSGAGQPATDPFVSRDGHAVLVVVRLEKGLSASAREVTTEVVTRRLERVSRDLPGSTGTVGGTKALIDEINGHVQDDLRVGEAVALPLSLLVMVMVFGGLLAAGIPILGAVASIAGGLLSLLGFSYAMDLSSTVPSVVSVMGLGLCIDYGLLLVSRYREELRRLHDTGGDGPSPQALERALERTLATAGRTVLFSGVTVAISVSGLMVFQATILRAVGAAGLSVVVVALLVALTLVPPLLAVAGDRLIRPGITHRVPGLSRTARRLGDVAPDQGVFSRLAGRVQRRPVLVVLGVLGVLVVAGLPVLSIRLVSSGVLMLPEDSVQRQLYEAVDTRFPAVAEPPIRVVSTVAPDRLQRWGTDVVAHLDGVASAGPVTQLGSGPHRVSVLDVRSTTPGQHGEPVNRLVERIQAHRPSFPAYVTGFNAQHVAFLDSISARAPLVVAVVVLATFVLLFLMTGSLLVPLKALVMNVVSLGASFGVLVWMFQDGHLQGPLHFSSAGGIDTTIPALVLAFAFGLSMDYEVFLLSRIKEVRDTGADNDTAVRVGLQRSGRIITSAALIVVIVFAGFASGQLLVIKQMGVALAVAVTVDATLVRVLLVPATMTLLGEWNWWAPAPLRRLHHRLGLREG